MASEIKWIKVAVDLFDDEKIMLIEAMPNADSIIVIWFKLLCFAGKQNNGGVFFLNDRIPYTDEMLSAIFRRSINDVRMALQIFESLGMIEIIDGAVTIPKWTKYQSMIDKKEYDRLAQQKHREKTKLLNAPSDVNDNVNDKSLNVKDKNKEIRNKNKEKEGKNSRFVPPTLDEVRTYCEERKNNIDPEYFIDYYASQQWKKANGRPVADWKACVRQWESKEKPKKETKEKTFDIKEYAKEQGWFD
jgi:predicted phage replisome organizer